MKLLKKLIPVVIVLLLSFWAVKPLFVPGFFPMHDDTQVSRVFEMQKSLKDGMFPVRWVMDLGYGYGYPIFNFYAPFSYYVGAIFMFFGFNALLATKLMLGLGIILAGIFMYLLAKEFWGKTGGIVSAILFVYAPYHALNIYVRGAIAELWAYAFLPLVFLAVYKVYALLKDRAYIEQKSNSKNQIAKIKSKLDMKIWLWVSISAISYAGIITSHNLTAMMVTPFIFLFSALLYINLRTNDRLYKPYYILLGLLIGISLAAFYWLPALLEMKFTDVLSVVGGGSNYKDHFVCLNQLWNSPWGFGGSGPGCIDGLSFKIGKLHILLGFISVLSIVTLFKSQKNKFYISILFLVFLLISTFLTLNQSKFIWDTIPQMAFFQFPWRFLSLVLFFLSFFGGSFIWFAENYSYTRSLSKYVYWILGVVTISLIVLLNKSIFVPQKILNISSNYYTDISTINWKISKISDEYMPKGFFKPLRSVDVPKNKFETASKNFKLLSITEKTQEIRAQVSSPNKSTVYVNTAYFPGWHVFIDNKQVWFKYSGQGLILDIPSGKHFVVIKFIQTPVEKVADAISLAGVIMLIAGIISHRKKLIYG